MSLFNVIYAIIAILTESQLIMAGLLDLLGNTDVKNNCKGILQHVFIGKQTPQQNVNNASGIQGVLLDLLGNGAKKEQSLVTQLLDADGDGSAIDDILGMVIGNKKGGLMVYLVVLSVENKLLQL